MTYIGCMNQLWRSAMMSPMSASDCVPGEREQQAVLENAVCMFHYKNL